jgi:hypothetical protein
MFSVFILAVFPLVVYNDAAEIRRLFIEEQITTYTSGKQHIWHSVMPASFLDRWTEPGRNLREY